MLRIGRLTDYAMLIMSHLAKAPQAKLSATALADQLTLTAPTVSKILKMLSDEGLVSATRGVEGGYRLAKAPETITVAAIITAMEGELTIMACCTGATCTLQTLCALRGNWININKLIQGLLARLTIIDMLEPIPLHVLSSQLVEELDYV